jgi:hypothetical protein
MALRFALQAEVFMNVDSSSPIGKTLIPGKAIAVKHTDLLIDVYSMKKLYIPFEKGCAV